ncbi:HID1-like protein [Mya arenaria]|uniref:HID1-like protein n=1 Tax=Mya arenaria TaxID=6604 RepID=A0ABY7DI93_MYAAR|nr:HID1-like protein [Mya arenaria]
MQCKQRSLFLFTFPCACVTSATGSKQHRTVYDNCEIIGIRVEWSSFAREYKQLIAQTPTSDEAFWEQFWSECVTCVQDVFTLIPAAEIRALREESPSNLATLCYKAVEKLVSAAESGCPSQREQQIVLNCIRLLTRVLPYIFEDPDWRGFFWSTLPGQGEEAENDSPPLAQTLLNALCDLLFCPEFTVASSRKSGPDNPEDMASIDSCEYIWESGVGFAHSPTHNVNHDTNRTDAHSSPNQWIHFFTSTENRHALPLFTSLLNVVCAYDPVGYGLPYNHLMFTDSREALVESALQVLCVTMENESTNQNAGGPDNLFVNYLSRIHREEKFMFYVLKSSDVLDILVPILYYLNDARADQSRVGLMHIGVFILLLLSGERNFGVRLNKPYTVRVPMDIPVFTGTHADFLIIVFHKIITTGHQRLQPLFDCLLTIVVNVSPYLKTLSMVASTKLLHLLEAFSTPWFLYASPTNHHLVFFLLERQVFHQLANLPTDHSSIAKALTKRGKKLTQPLTPTDHTEPQTMDGALPAAEAEPGTLKHFRAVHEVYCPKSVKQMVKEITSSCSTVPSKGLEKMTEHTAPDEVHKEALQELATSTGTMSIQPRNEIEDPMAPQGSPTKPEPKVFKSPSTETPPATPTTPTDPGKAPLKRAGSNASAGGGWVASPEWVHTWKHKLPLQTIMRMGLTDESEILKFLQHGTLVGLLPVPHPILIRKYQANSGTTMWFRTNVDPPIWYDTNVKLFEIQRV